MAALNRMRAPFLSLFLPLLISACGSALCFATEPVTGIRLDNSPAAYDFRDGEVLKDGKEINAGSDEAERVRRVALFYRWLDNDPFFLSPGADLGGLEEAAGRLAKEEKVMLAQAGTSERIYPVGFLKAYAAASRDFDLLAGTPSEKAAVEVLRQIKAGVADYSALAESLPVSMEKSFTVARKIIVACLGGENAHDRNTVLGDLALIKKNSAAASERTAELEKCLLVSSAYCRPGFPVFIIPGPAADVAGPPKLLPKAVIDLGRAPLRGPYLVDTSCWGGRTRNLVYYSEQCQSGQDCIEWEELATDMYFQRTTFKGTIHEKLSGLGIKLVEQSATSPYTCNDLEYKATLQTLDAFTLRYSSTPLFGKAAAKRSSVSPGARVAFDAAAAAEVRFFSGKIKSQDDLESLGRAYLGAFTAVEGTGSPLSRPLRERLRMISLRTPGFGRVINRLAFHAAHVIEEVKSSTKLLPPWLSPSSSMFLSRNHYSIVFMSFSPSVWRIQERPAYLIPASGRNRKIYIDYNEAVAEYGQAEVDKALKYAAGHSRREFIGGQE